MPCQESRPCGRTKVEGSIVGGATCALNEHRTRHRSCPACGMHPYGVEGIDPAAIPTQQFNGRAL